MCSMYMYPLRIRIRHILQNLAGLDDALDLVDHCRADTHYADIRQLQSSAL